MRLRTLRLAGFKSFVDPTTIAIPSDLVGVVGPNGCGKSNIIDAVRWVMGETSAKHLRGGTMADVVFTGSNTRAAVSQASVELVFDNSEGRVGGRFAAFGEISVKREIGREGQSAYFLNGARVRRRDVMDVFLGTGLGPRSYAIIEQGMISRIVEAKPEDLRDFFEEAAGISKYKERRRETETRIRHTQENLDRLGDLTEELGKRLTHLKRQATMAEKYKVLKQEERTLKSQLEALRWRELDHQATEHGERIGAQDNRLQSVIAEQRALESRIEKSRNTQAQASEAFNTVYRQVLEAGAAIARSEETIQNLRSRRDQLGVAGGREHERLEAARAQSNSEEHRLGELRNTLSTSEPALARLQEQSGEARVAFREAEEGYLDWQSEGEALNERAAVPARTKHAEEARLEQLENSLHGMQERLDALVAQTPDDEIEELSELLAALDIELHECSNAVEASHAALALQQNTVREIRDRGRAEADTLHQSRDRVQGMRGRLSSLEALQQAALGKDSGPLNDWLNVHGLAGAARLAERIEVQNGYETAVESVLDDALEAIEVDDLLSVATALGPSADGLRDSGVGFVEASAGSAIAASLGAGESAKSERLAARVRGPGLANLLAGVYFTESLQSALDARGDLANGERLVTRDGIQIGLDWIKVPGRDTEQSGVLAREREMQRLNQDAQVLDAQVIAQVEQAEATRVALHRAEEELAAAQTALAAVQEHRSGVRSRQGETRTRREQAQRQEAERQQRMQQLSERIIAEQQVQTQASERLRVSNEQMQLLSGERERWEALRDQRRQHMEQTRDGWHEVRDEAYDLGLKVESMRAQAASLVEGQTRARELIVQLEQRVNELEGELNGLRDPLDTAQTDLQAQLAQRRDFDVALESARAQSEQEDATLKALQESRQSAERRVSIEREALEGLRMASQEIIVRRKTIEELLAEHDLNASVLLEGLDTDALTADWEQRLQGTERSISRLGPINLAAIEEFDQQFERKTYLDAQHADLDEALATLKDAIQKIDRETRSRFKETYEKVNAGLKKLFPQLFGGGYAELQMTGDDLLSTGISIIARPPGKRNTSIHLLSGGEKALTAVALVFAIFELNPAPFCLLDEVDAPLDDTNVGRFCELVKTMSEQVQFLIVTHNKLTMEIAQQLIGVTMHEPGVSRLVAVDIAEAVQMAAA
ncbi:MAG: chromosome segregation protein [Gammaproteobacteria bacterium]|jgi:chromosome segregation protein